MQKSGERDRRQRLLYATERGAALSARLDDLQAKRVAQALATAGLAEAGDVRSFLFGMITRKERPLVQSLLPAPFASRGDQ
jgi:DNA-binding MarR family transcriptional regulator